MNKIPKLVRRIIRIQPKGIKPVPAEERQIDMSKSIEKNLKNPDPLIRALSIEVAGRIKIKEKSVVKTLIELLKDPLHVIRQKAAMALGKIGAHSAVGELIKLLSDESEEVRITAAGVLGLLKDREAVPALIMALQEKNPQIKMKAAISLGLIGDKKAVLPISLLLKDENELVRKYAVEALGNIGRAAIPVLLESLNDEKVRAYSMEVLLKIK